MIRDSPSFADAVVDAVNTLPAGEQATACTMPGIFSFFSSFLPELHGMRPEPEVASPTLRVIAPVCLKIQFVFMAAAP
jgi:hypothetical protein